MNPPDQFERWIEPPEKPRKTTALVIAYAALAIAALGLMAAFANFALNLQTGG